MGDSPPSALSKSRLCFPSIPKRSRARIVFGSCNEARVLMNLLCDRNPCVSAADCRSVTLLLLPRASPHQPLVPVGQVASLRAVVTAEKARVGRIKSNEVILRRYIVDYHKRGEQKVRRGGVPDLPFLLHPARISQPLPHLRFCWSANSGGHACGPCRLAMRILLNRLLFSAACPLRVYPATPDQGDAREARRWDDESSPCALMNSDGESEAYALVAIVVRVPRAF